MFEELLEDIAQKNNLRGVNTYLKLITGLAAILFCLVSDSFIPPLFIACILTGTVVILAKVDARTYSELFLLPLSFAIMSVAGIILITGGNTLYWQWTVFPGFSVSVTRESINLGVLVFCRIIGGMSALCFISLTTPMTDIFITLRRCHVPEPVIDLMMIIYRTIFILMDQVVQIYHAQVMRLGYSRYQESVLSFATLCGAAFIASWDAGDDLVRAMDARCYQGRFATLGQNNRIEIVPVLFVAAFIVLTTAVVFFSGTGTII